MGYDTYTEVSHLSAKPVVTYTLVDVQADWLVNVLVKRLDMVITRADLLAREWAVAWVVAWAAMWVQMLAGWLDLRLVGSWVLTLADW